MVRRVLRWPVEGVLMAKGRRAIMAVESWSRIVVDGVAVLLLLACGCEKSVMGVEVVARLDFL